MSLLKSKFNLCILEIPKEFTITQGEAFKALQENKFKELTPSQDFGHGWVDIEDMFNTDFTMESTVAVNSIVGGYRYDKKSVPAALVKKLFKERLKDREKEEGHKLEKADKEILKEECRQQLILKALASPKLITWIWDVDNSRIYVDAKSTGIIEKFMTLFTGTFKVPKITIKNYGLNEDHICNFLDWIWKNTTNIEATWIDQGVTLDADKNIFKFTGPSLEEYLEEIENLKKGKSVKSLNVGIALGDEDYSLTFGSKNLIASVESSSKIKHESVETAILDNQDRINSLIDKIQKTVNQFLA